MPPALACRLCGRNGAIFSDYNLFCCAGLAYRLKTNHSFAKIHQDWTAFLCGTMPLTESLDD